MRRRVGVGHVLQERQQQQKMADLGAQITAERVGQIEDQLEELQQQLRKLAQNHKADIKEDPVVRARFRQLADSLGVDLISSKKNVFAGALGLGDFYYQLAGRAVEACMKEGKFCGAYVPLQRVQFFVQKAYDASTLAAGKDDKRIVISEADIVTALSKLSVLGAGYVIVQLGGVSYIQTTPDGAVGSDNVHLLNYVLGLQKEQVEKAKRDAVKVERQHTSPAVLSASPTSREGSSSAPGRSGVGAAYAMGAHPFELRDDAARDMDVKLTFAQQCVALRESQVATGLCWELHRACAALKRMVQEGTVWVEEPQVYTTRSKSTSGVEKKSSAGKAAVFSATEDSKEVWKGGKHGAEEAAARADVVYWFVSLTAHA